ncbi:MAG: hypothetical protein MJK04_34245 [Psychrosphaera sp.]|nr:hypothetical protein [Psychrosphaera sp.]
MKKPNKQSEITDVIYTFAVTAVLASLLSYTVPTEAAGWNSSQPYQSQFVLPQAKSHIKAIGPNQ